MDPQRHKWMREQADKLAWKFYVRLAIRRALLEDGINWINGASRVVS